MPETSATTGPLGPIEIRLEAHARAPAEIVWALLVDWEHLDRWMLEASKPRVTSEEREGVGTEVRTQVRIGGITTVDSVRVVRWEPPHALGIEHLGRVKGSATIRCIPTDRGTRVEWAERLEPPMGAIGGIGIRLFKPLMTKVFTRDLSVLKRLAETEAGTRTAGTGPDAAGTGPAGRRATRERARGQEASSLFARWFWLVYLPLALLGLVLVVTLAGLMPKALVLPLLLVTGAWSALALRMLVERRRKALAVPAPRSIVLGIGAVALLALGGGMLAWIGIARLSTSAGLAMLLVGSFFMLMALFAPMFKLVDSGFRFVAKLVSKPRRTGSPSPPAPAPADSSPVTSPTQK